VPKPNKGKQHAAGITSGKGARSDGGSSEDKGFRWSKRQGEGKHINCLWDLGKMKTSWVVSKRPWVLGGARTMLKTIKCNKRERGVEALTRTRSLARTHR